MKRFIVDIYRSCVKHDLLNLSANISFFAILALLPLSMLFVSLLGHFLGGGGVVTEITRTFAEAIPGAGEMLNSNLKNLIEDKSALGFWGVSFLLIISTVLFGSLERAFDKIFGASKKRHFLLSKLLSIAVIFIILILLALPSTVKIFEVSISRFGFSFPLADYISGKVFYVIFAIVAYVMTVVIVTNHKVFFRYAFIGGVLFAAGTAVAKYLFQWYLAVSFSRYNLIYGSLTALILVVIWIYYLANILLLSAEVVAYLQGRRR